MMTPHGPDSAAFLNASSEQLKPARVADGTMVGFLVSDAHNAVVLIQLNVSDRRSCLSLHSAWR